MTSHRRKPERPSFMLGVFIGALLFALGTVAWSITAPVRHDIATLTVALLGG